MDLETASLLAEIVGALVVVVSLLYLGVQSRQNTNGVKRSSTADAIAAFREWNYLQIVDTTIRQLFIKGAKGLENLSDDERAQFWPYMFTYYKTAELMHFQYINGAMDEGVWAGWESLLSSYCTLPGLLQFYEDRRLLFSPRFQEWMENQTPIPEFIPLGQNWKPSAEPVSQ